MIDVDVFGIIVIQENKKIVCCGPKGVIPTKKSGNENDIGTRIIPKILVFLRTVRVPVDY